MPAAVPFLPAIGAGASIIGGLMGGDEGGGGSPTAAGATNSTQGFAALPPEVQQALSTIAKGNMTGKQAWKAAIRESGNPYSSIAPKVGALFDTPEAAANNLKRLGIPGIRYLDEGSRDAGQGTSNFVIFPGNEHMLQIQDINGNPIND